MNEFQVPTHGIPVQIFLDGSECLRGRLFAAPDRYHEGDREEVAMLLNDDRGFLPFLVEEAAAETRSVVLNKAHILRVRLSQEDTASPHGAAEPPGAAEELTVLHLTDGTRVQGRVLVETPPAASRLVDKVNMAPRFIPVMRDGGVDFVQRTHVRRLD
jgi:hypothetical protein